MYLFLSNLNYHNEIEIIRNIHKIIFKYFQQYKESEDAQRYMTFYPVNDWPYVSILDPRTGELLVTWSKLEASSFCDLVTEFLSLHPSLEPNEDSNTNSTTSKDDSEPPNKKPKSVIRDKLTSFRMSKSQFYTHHKIYFTKPSSIFEKH